MRISDWISDVCSSDLYLLRSLCSRSYFALGKEIVPGQKVLDLGCLYLNNLMPFADRGLDLYGVEINEDMVAVATERAADMGMAVEYDAGPNRAMPFPDGTFNFIRSTTPHPSEDGKKARTEGRVQ